MEDLVKAINTLNKASLVELKSFANPPNTVVEIMKGILILFKIPGEPNWMQAKRLLRDTNHFINCLLNYDVQNVDAETIQKLKTETAIDSLNYDQVKSVSASAACLFQWIKGVEAISAQK